jgi:ferric-dicitrate binding protein FerR (iron transport regulator)
MVQLFHKYFQGKTTEEEERQMMDYVDSSDEARKKYLRERQLWDAFLLNTDMDESKIMPFSDRIIFRKLRPFIRVAAVFALLISVFYFTNRHPAPQEKTNLLTVHVPEGGLSNVQLPDGSVVYLNSRTTLCYPSSFNKEKREVEISGEGYFEVVKGDIPFIVKSDHCQITVMGTVFDVKDYKCDKYSQVSLLSGSVKINLNNENQSEVLLSPDEQIVFDGHNYELKNISNYDHFLWKEGILIFDDMPFVEMVSMLEKCFNVKFIVNNTEVLQYKCTGKFVRSEGINHILKVLQKNVDFKYRYNNNIKNEIIID